MADLFTFCEPENARWTGQLDAATVQADWHGIVSGYLSSPSGQALQVYLRERLAAGATIYPPAPLRALALTALRDVRVVILGQDPYHGAGQAEGLAFSVQRGVRIPPSLRNIFKERERDLGLPAPTQGSLLSWAQQGILLLNTTLTVEEGQPASHAKRGWELLTDQLIAACARKAEPVAFLLWGSHAQAKASLIASHNSDARHIVLSANHPSPLSALRAPEPFIGCGHFSATRHALAARGLAAQALFAD
jgi:uracil-DNA glycosylase